MKDYPTMWTVYAPPNNGDPEFWRWVIGVDVDRVKWKTFGTDGTHFDSLDDWLEWAKDSVIVAHPVTPELK